MGRIRGLGGRVGLAKSLADLNWGECGSLIWRCIARRRLGARRRRDWWPRRYHSVGVHSAAVYETNGGARVRELIYERSALFRLSEQNQARRGR